MPRRDQFNSEAEWLAHLRLYFAAKAMAALIGTAAGPCIVNGLDGAESCVARAAYRMADSMLAARSTEAK